MQNIHITYNDEKHAHKCAFCKDIRHEYTYKGKLKSLYDDVISTVYNFFDQWDQSTAATIEEVC